MESKNYDSNKNIFAEAKKKRKDFRDLGKKMQRERTDKILNLLNEFLSEEDNSINLTELLGYLLCRVNYYTDRDLANIFQTFSITLLATINHLIVMKQLPSCINLSLVKNR